MKKYILSVILLPLVLVLAGCKKDDPVRPYPAGVSESRTLLVYLASQNSLGGAFPTTGYDNLNIAAMVKGATYANIGNNKVIVYHDLRNGGTELLEISAGEDGKGRKILLETYSDQDFDKKETFQEAVDLMMGKAPAGSYGLVVWSHASGWLPGATTRAAQQADTPPAIMPMSILQDGTRYMELSEFAEAVPAGVFDFIIFDECYMSGVEVLWALRDKTDYIVASAAEVYGAGMPYDLILPYIFATQARLGAGGVCEEYYNYYDDPSLSLNNFQRSATTALFDCTKIEDGFAANFKAIVTANSDELKALTTAGLQYYDRYDLSGYPGYGVYANLIFEIGDLVNALCEEGDPLRVRFFDDLSRIIKYKATTRFVFERAKDRDKFTGMTSYIPFSAAKYRTLNNKYKDTEWYRSAYPADFIE